MNQSCWDLINDAVGYSDFECVKLLQNEACVHRKIITVEGVSKTIYFLDKRSHKVKYVRMICDPLHLHQKVMETIISDLNKGDVAILESIDLSKGSCFPRSYIFDRFREIIKDYQIAFGHPNSSVELQAIHSGSKVQIGVPCRLDENQKSIPAAILKSIRSNIGQLNVVDLAEFDVVIQELERLSQNKGVSINLIAVNKVVISY